MTSSHSRSRPLAGFVPSTKGSPKGLHFRPSTEQTQPGRSWAGPGSRRAGITLIDQGFASISNFAVGVAVARAAGASGLGGFTFAYTGWMVLSAMHRALIIDPMAIEGDIRDASTTYSIKRGFAAEVLLGVCATICFVVVGGALMLANQHTFGYAMLVMAPWLPVLVVQDYWRWVGFMTRRPGRALANDTVFNCVQGVAFAAVFVLHLHSQAALISSWGLGALAGVVYGLHQSRVLPSLRGGLSLLRARWSISKWIAGSSLTGLGASMMYVFVAGAILGPVGLGGLKAAQALVAGPSGVLIQAGGSIGLPEATRAYDEQGWRGLIRVARVVTAAGFLSFVVGAGIVAVWGGTLLSHIYGTQFGHLETAAVLFGIGYIFMGFWLGPILVLKSTRQTRWLLHVQIVSLAVSIGFTFAFCVVWGVNGAALATIVTAAATALAFKYSQARVRRSKVLEEKVVEAATVALDDYRPLAVAGVNLRGSHT